MLCWERQTEREREGVTERGRETERGRDRERETEGGRQRDRQRDREIYIFNFAENVGIVVCTQLIFAKIITKRQKDREMEKDRETERDISVILQRMWYCGVYTPHICKNNSCHVRIPGI